MTKLSDEELERLREIAQPSGQPEDPDEDGLTVAYLAEKRRAGGMAPIGSTAKSRATVAAHNAEHVAYLHGSGHWSGRSRPPERST